MEPPLYNESLANSIYLLVARDFAPPEKRTASIKARLEKIPAVIAQAKANLKNPPQVYTETAIDQTQGAISLIKEGLKETLDKAPQAKAGLAPLQEKTIAALEEYKTWLKNDLLPRSTGDFRIGPDKFRKKLRFALASDMSMEDLMKAARTDLERTQKAIYETALRSTETVSERGRSHVSGPQESHRCRARQRRNSVRPTTRSWITRKVLKEATDFVNENLVRCRRRQSTSSCLSSSAASDRLLRFSGPLERTARLSSPSRPRLTTGTNNGRIRFSRA
jgi:hypothetical protein